MVGGQRHDRRDAEHRRVAHDGVHLVALEQTDGQGDLNGRLGRGCGFTNEAQGHRALLHVLHLGGPLVAPPVEDAHVGADPGPQHACEMVRVLLAERERLGRRVDPGHEESRRRHGAILPQSR